MSKLKYLSLLVVGFLSLSQWASACTEETLSDMTNNIRFYNDDAPIQVDLAIQNITQLCDENLYVAGYKIGDKFPSYEPVRVRRATMVLLQRLADMPPDMVRGLGLALIENIAIYYPDTTTSFANTVVDFGTKYTYLAKEFAIELLKKKNSSYPQENQIIQNAVDRLKIMIENGGSGATVPSSIWAFHSKNQSCDHYSGPWGYYYPCMRYYTSVSDQLGNRLILTCKNNESGIQFRVKLGNNMNNQLYNSHIESVSFGTNNFTQAMGEAYYIGQDNSLFVTEPISEELLTRLKSDKELRVNFRINSGEVNIRLAFNLKGSSKAVSKLIQVCK
jgi:hypothetical protein